MLNVGVRGSSPRVGLDRELLRLCPQPTSRPPSGSSRLAGLSSPHLSLFASFLDLHSVEMLP
jgi:hypothetical protein